MFHLILFAAKESSVRWPGVNGNCDWIGILLLFTCSTARAGRGVAFPSPTTPTLVSNKFYVDVTWATLK